jgi:Tat protein secretion system quality control protein TatD with DNase activity
MKVPIVGSISQQQQQQQQAQEVALLLPFDAHNHIQLSSTPMSLVDWKTTIQQSLCGMAIMSTHPRDFDKVLDMAMSTNPNLESSSSSESTSSFCVVPCLGVHPWFLHELVEDDWTIVTAATTTTITTAREIPRWVADLEDMILQHSHVMVGEIGLDKHHFDLNTRQLKTPLSKQIEAFQYQLELAMIHQRPVSIHCVRAIGPLMDTIQHVICQCKSNYSKQWHPPKLYFHAFGGKAATAKQIITSIEKQFPTTASTTTTTTTMMSSSLSSTNVYFGFAPIINFTSGKTMDVIRTVGLHRLVLETDLEDWQQIPSSMTCGIEMIARALDVTPKELIAATNTNVRNLYNLR